MTLYVIRTKTGYVGSPTNTTTSNRNLAATFRECELAAARGLADSVGGTVIQFTEAEMTEFHLL